jgi:hypothetical protein
MLRFLIRLALLPFRIALAAVVTGLRVGLGLGRLPVRLTRGLGRALGRRAVATLVLGVVLGLLFAPGRGRDLRDRLKAMLAAGEIPGDATLAERITFELEHAPRTWHLPQPTVSVTDGRVVLAGRVDLEAARDELARVAGAVPGVVAVENQLVVEASDEVAR